MRTRVKVCGITSAYDARAAVEAGAHALGFIFHPASPRFIEPTRARQIVLALPPFVSSVGVFVDAPIEDAMRVAQEAGLTMVQLHGGEPPEYCARFIRPIKALRIRRMSDLDAMQGYDVPAFLLDAYDPAAHGGTGRAFDWSIATEAVRRGGRIILAGGLTPRNVADAIRTVRPYAVDVSSGVEESPGVKDHAAIHAFMRAVREADAPVVS